MELKREKKKLLSESNLRLLTSLTISLANKVDSTAEKCINPFTPNTPYAKGVYVTHDNYIYESKLACNDADWVESHWIRLSDTIEELTVDDVKSYLSLTQQQLDTLSSIISTEVRLDKCFSSSDTYMRIQDALKEAKQYCITELAKKSTGSFKKANDVSEVTDGNYLYLIFNNGTSKYDIYALVDSNVELLTSVDVNLDDYFTKTEIEADFLKKTDAASTYAEIATVDGKVDKTSILTATSTTATDEQVYSANVVNKSISNQGIYSGDVNEIPMIKPDVLYSYSVRYESCTNLPDMCGHGILENMYLTSINFATQRLTAINTKTVYMRVKGGGTWGDWIKLSTAEDKMVKVNGDVLEYIKNNPKKNLTIYWDTTDTNTPYTAGFTGSGGGTLISNVFDENWGSVIGTCGGDFFCINRLMRGTWQGWEKLCTTGVADVPVTNITTNLVSTKVALDNSDSYATYYVKSGTCYVTIWSLRLIEACSVETIFNGLPKSTIGVTCPLCNGVESFAQVFMSPNSGVIAFNANASLINKSGYCSFSYPVAES